MRTELQRALFRTPEMHSDHCREITVIYRRSSAQHLSGFVGLLAHWWGGDWHLAQGLIRKKSEKLERWGMSVVRHTPSDTRNDILPHHPRSSGDPCHPW